MMKNTYQNNRHTLMLLILMSFILFSNCRKSNKVGEEQYRCFQLFSSNSKKANYYLESTVKSHRIGDSLCIEETILKIPNNAVDSPKLFNRAVYLLIEGTLFKKYSGNNEDIINKFLTINDTNEVSYKQFANRIPQSNIYYHLIEKNETRKFLGSVSNNSDTLYKFLVEENHIDGSRRFEFYNTRFFLVKTIFLSSSVGLDSIVAKPSCR